MASYSNITIEQGTKFETIIDVINSDNSVFNLDGYTAKCTMRKSHYTSSGYEITVTVYDAAAGQIKMSITPAESYAWKPGRYVYDVIVRNTDDSDIERVIEGIINLTPAVTQLT